MKFPNNKKFAFSIFDDADQATLENIAPVYKLLEKLKIRTTKSVWVFAANNPGDENNLGQSLSDTAYLKFILNLKKKGFEIGFHGARGGDSAREETINAIKIFKDKIGYYPKTFANHYINKENIYWGAGRLNRFFGFFYRLFRKNKFYGQDKKSIYFWGDVCKKYIKYIRNFTFKEVNTLKVDSGMPYHDSDKHYVNFWFSSSDGKDVNSFNKLISEKNMSQLEKEQGACIVYTHFAKGFVKNGKINSKTRQLLENLSKKQGWFVPVETLLDYLAARQNGKKEISFLNKLIIELRWMLEKMFKYYI